MKPVNGTELQLDRQSFLGLKSGPVLQRTRVAIVGLGGGGSHIAQQLGHLGVGEFVLFDPDVVESTNLNRLVGATQRDVVDRATKVSVASRTIRGVNPKAQVDAYASQWQMSAVGLRSCDIIFGCVDSIGEREQLEAAARRFLVPYVDLGMDVHKVGGGFVVGGQVALSMPEGPCLRCMGIVNDRDLELEAKMYGAAGGRPQVVWPNGILASLAVGMFAQLFVPWNDLRNLSILLEFDGNAQTVAPSNKLLYLRGQTCPHFAGLHNVGDAFWTQPAGSKESVAKN